VILTHPESSNTTCSTASPIEKIVCARGKFSSRAAEMIALQSPGEMSENKVNR
jgi:hypothetical protein